MNHLRAYRAHRRKDLRFRIESSLQLSLLINLLYGAYKAVLAIWLHSSWAGASAFYYAVLSIARHQLLRGIHLQSPARIRRKYHLCGWMLLLLTIPISAIGARSIFRGESAHYPGHMIYAAASYTFYSLTMAIIGLIRGRRLRSPIHIAAKILTLANALTAIFSLQCAMIVRFGGNPQFQNTMNTITGLAVFISVAGMSAYMILDRR